MSGYLNRATLIGNLGADPEVRTTQSGARVVSFSIATTESWKDKVSGERVERTEWHRVVVWNEGLGKIAEQYLRKGAKVFLEGKISTRKWTDQSGQDRYITEIVVSPYEGTLKFLSSAREDNRSSLRNGSGAGADCGSGPSGSAPTDGDLDDEVPF